MAIYNGKFSCGHDGIIDVNGKSSERQWKIEKRFAGLCPDCYKKQQTELKEKEILDRAKELNYPDLAGTEKQINWALKIRDEKIKEILRFKRTPNVLQRRFSKNGYEVEVTDNFIDTIANYMIQNKTFSKWYIDNRYDDEIYITIYIEILNSEKDDNIEEDFVPLQKLEKEIIVFPENKKYEIPVQIRIINNTIQATFEKNDTFREIVKSLGYKWTDSCWKKTIEEINGTVKDIAAELANNLLNAGFGVNMYDKEIIEKAINGNFKKEQSNIIYRLLSKEYENYLIIRWRGMNNDLYEKARKLPYSRWYNKGVIVPVKYYKEIEDFAELYNFKFSDGAKELLESYKNNIESAYLVKPKELEEKEEDPLKAILKSGSDVIDDLKD